MRAVTIKEAKAHLNELVEAALRGDQVVIMRGATHVAALVPISAAEIELAPRLTDAQAERLWHTLADAADAGSIRVFDSPAVAIRFLDQSRRKGAAPSRRNRQKRRTRTTR